MKKFLNAVKWIIQNGLILVLAWYGLHNNVVWCWNITKFLIWLSLLSWFFLVIARNSEDKVIKGMRDEGNPGVPLWFARLSDIYFMIFLAAYGHFVLALIIVWNCLSGAYFYSKED